MNPTVDLDFDAERDRETTSFNRRHQNRGLVEIIRQEIHVVGVVVPA
jgi:hypothetical protein